jgi:hypothetical protein
MNLEGGSQPRLRKYLLTTASGAALIGSAPFAQADTNIDHIYVDLGGQYTFNSGRTSWLPPFGFFGPQDEPQIRLKNGWDGRGDLALQSGNWYLTLSADFGRTGTSHAHVTQTKYVPYSSHSRVGSAKHEESHTVIDFTLGKDVGLGMLGLDGSSIISAGVRYAHFVARTRVHVSYCTFGSCSSGYDHQLDRQFAGWGPVITWKGKAPIEPDFAFAWGLNAAAVLGNRSFETDFTQIRHKNIISPQVGGYAGIDWRMPDSPLDVMLGYRGDGYFSIIDKGFTTRHYGDRISHGPFVQIGWQIE